MKLIPYGILTSLTLGFGFTADLVQFSPGAAAYKGHCTPVSHYVVSGGNMISGDHICVEESIHTWILLLAAWYFIGSVINGKLLLLSILLSEEEAN